MSDIELRLYRHLNDQILLLYAYQATEPGAEMRPVLFWAGLQWLQVDIFEKYPVAMVL
jgi:hypothetical protein